MLKTCLALLINYLLVCDILAQPCNDPYPPGLTCEDPAIFCNLSDLDGYCTTLPDFDNPTGPNPACAMTGGGGPNNTIWFGFVAGTSTISIEIKPLNCVPSPNGLYGIQAGIWSDPCPPGGAEVVCEGNCTTSPITLTSSSFIPGNFYYLWVDGCNGSYCDITIDVLQGSGGGGIMPGPIGNINGPKKVCTGGSFNYSVNPVQYAKFYYWTLDGNLLFDPAIANDQINVIFQTPGVHQLCLDVANYCSDVGLPPAQKCIDITVNEITGINPPKAIICKGDNFAYNGDYYNVGDYDIKLTSWQGCDSVVTLSVEEFNIPPKDLGIIYKCYPECITISDSWGNGGVYCKNGESEEVNLQTWKGCDSIVIYTLRLINLNVKIEPPLKIGCSVNQSTLDGSKTLIGLDNYETLDIKWTALNGGFISGPDDDIITTTQTGGKYCLTVTATAPGGVEVCKDSACVIVNYDPSSPTASIIGDTLYCSKDTVTLTGITLDSNATYSWTGPGGIILTGKKIKVTVPGVYNLTVTASNLCQAKASYNVINLQDGPTRPKASASVLHNLSCDSLQVALYGSSSLNLPSITYSWSLLSNVISSAKDTFADKPGDYLFIVTNNINGCADSVVVNVGQDTIKPDIAATNDTTNCLTGTATLKGSSTTPNVLFSWWTIPLGSTPIATTPDVSVPAGKYNLEVRNPVNGCRSDITVEAIADENTPDISLIKDNDLNCNLLVSTLTASSSISGLGYVWSGGTTTGDPKVITTTKPGNFTITVTNPLNQCKSAAMIAVTQDTASPIISAITDTIKCNNPTAHIDGTSNLLNNTTIGWKDPSGNPAAAVLDFTTTTPGVYILTVTNTINGCAKSINLIVPQNITIPNISATGAKIDCANLIVTAKGNSTTPNVNFKWSGPGGFSATTKDATGINTKGTYTFTVTDKVNGCSSAQDVTVDEDIKTPDLVLTGGTLTCTNNKSVTLTATSTTAGVTYSWTGPNGFTSTQQNPVVTAAGTYSATVTNSVNHCTFNTSVDVLDDTTPPDLSVNDAVIDCINTSQVLTAVSSTPGIVYSWNGPGVVNDPNSNITVTKAGAYIIQVTAPNGCKFSQTSTVSLNAILPVAVATAIGELNCTTKSVQVNTNGSSTGPQYVYTWTGPGTISNNQQFDATVAGVYALTITNSTNGCSKDTTVIVPENLNKPTGFITDLANPKCFGGNNGSISVPTVTGGTPPYLYSINGKPFSSQNQFTFLTDGTYKISVQDAAGCEIDDLFTLVQPKKLVIHAGKDSIIKWGTPITLYADTINAANVETITWTPNLDSTCFNCLNPTVTLFDAQLFTITAKDFNGCVSSDKLLILVKKERPVFIPNTFSPNGDGINDIFFINAGEGIEEVTYFQVYDRWGEKIFDKQSFQPNDPAYGWNGNFRGKSVNSGVYVYWAMIKFKDGESILYKGDVTIKH